MQLNIFAVRLFLCVHCQLSTQTETCSCFLLKTSFYSSFAEAHFLAFPPGLQVRTSSHFVLHQLNPVLDALRLQRLTQLQTRFLLLPKPVLLLPPLRPASPYRPVHLLLPVRVTGYQRKDHHCPHALNLDTRSTIATWYGHKYIYIYIYTFDTQALS